MQLSYSQKQNFQGEGVDNNNNKVKIQFSMLLPKK